MGLGLGINNTGVPQLLQTEISYDLNLFLSSVEFLGGSVNAARQNAINTLFSTLTSASLLTKLAYLGFYNATDSFIGCNVPLIRPVGLSNAALINFVSGDWSSGGLAGRVTCYVNTLFNPVIAGLSVNNCSLFTFIDQDYSHPDIYFGANFFGTALQVSWGTATGPGFSRIGNEPLSGVAIVPFSKFILVTRRSSTDIQGYRDNGANVTSMGTSNIANIGSLPNMSLFSMGLNITDFKPQYFMTGGRCSAFGVFKSGLTGAEVQTLYTAIDTCHTALKAA